VVWTDVRCELRTKAVELEALRAKLADTENELRIRVTLDLLCQLVKQRKLENCGKYAIHTESY